MSMEKMGIIPKNLEKCDTPTREACMYDKYTLKPWRGRSRKTPHKPLKVTKPGKIVSVDHIVSPTTGLVAQMTDILTTNRYRYATVFVDQFSIYSYMHLQNTASDKDTLEGKHDFEMMAASHGIIIKQ